MRNHFPKKAENIANSILSWWDTIVALKSDEFSEFIHLNELVLVELSLGLSLNSPCVH